MTNDTFLPLAPVAVVGGGKQVMVITFYKEMMRLLLNQGPIRLLPQLFPSLGLLRYKVPYVLQ